MHAYLLVVNLVRTGLLNIGAIGPRTFPLTSAREAMEGSPQTAGNLECVIVQPVSSSIRWMYFHKGKAFRIFANQSGISSTQ